MPRAIAALRFIPGLALAAIAACGSASSDSSDENSGILTRSLNDQSALAASGAPGGPAGLVDASLTRGYSAEECGSCAEWNEPQAPFRIFGNTYYVGTRGLASILITSSEGHVLIDGGLPDTAPQILENIAALGFDVDDVELILNSHAHHDHGAGIAALQAASGGVVAASPETATALRSGKPDPNDPQFGLLLDFPPVTEVEEFMPGERLMVGPVSMTPYSTPGHMPGGTTWSWRSCEGDSCLDIVYADSQSSISADGYRFTDSPALADFERGYAAIEELSCDILITPHPSASSLWERYEGGAGLVDPDACRRYAATARDGLARRLESERTAR